MWKIWGIRYQSRILIGEVTQKFPRKWDLRWLDTFRNAERVGIAETPWSRVNYKRRCKTLPPLRDREIEGLGEVWLILLERTRINDELQDEWRIVGFSLGLWFAGKDPWLTCFKLPKVRGSVTWRIIRQIVACIVSAVCVLSWMWYLRCRRFFLKQTCLRLLMIFFDLFKILCLNFVSPFILRKMTQLPTFNLSNLWFLFPSPTSPRFFSVRRRPGGPTHRRTWRGCFTCFEGFQSSTQAAI